MACTAIRFLIAFMVFLAFALDAASRAAMSITVIAMTNSSAGFQQQNSTDELLSTAVSFDWDPTIQGYVLNSIYVGMLLSQLPAGHLAESFSLKWVLGYGIFFMSLLQVFAPQIARWNVFVFIFSRIVSGLSVGVVFPSSNSLISRWSPLQERTLMITAALQGYAFGPIVASIFAGEICERFGWEYVFYLLGGVGVLWSLAWYFVVASSPEKHWWISEEEKIKILEEREGNFDRDRVIPWRKIFTSGPVIVLCVRALTIYIMYAIFFTYIPTFFAHMYKITLTSNGWIVGIGILATSVVALLSSALADRLLQSGYSIDLVRKSFATSSTALTAVLALVMTQVENDFLNVLIIFMITCIVWGLYGGSDAALPIDLSAEYAGAVSALQNVFANVSMIAVPMLVGWFIETTEDFKRWNDIFMIGSFTSILGTVVFLVFGTAEKQDWSSAPAPVDDDQPLVDPL